MKHYEMVEIPGGAVVAVGPFSDADDAQAFAESITAFDSDLPVDSRGGIQAYTLAELAKVLDVTTSTLTAYRKA
jgi:hypothetical protein